MSTVHDVAKLAGVSTATVSRVINEQHVSEKLTKKVKNAISELGFQPNNAAKYLRTLKTDKIILTVPDIKNTFFSTIISSAQETARKHGYTLLLGEVGPNGEIEEIYARLIQRNEADGLIFLGRHLPDSLRELVSARGGAAPVVNGCEFDDAMGVSSVMIDDFAAAQEVTNYLYDLGHERIGIITGDMGGPVSHDRLNGVSECAEGRGRRGDLQVTIADYSFSGGSKAARALLQSRRRPTAIFCFSDDMAIATLKVATELGLRCPEDISIVGFDDIPLAEYVSPGLTTVRQPKQAYGRETVELLIGILEGSITERKLITLETELIVRGSTCPPATR